MSAVTLKYAEVIADSVKHIPVDDAERASLHRMLGVAKLTGDPDDVVQVIKAFEAKGQSREAQIAALAEVGKISPKLSQALSGKLSRK